MLVSDLSADYSQLYSKLVNNNGINYHAADNNEIKKFNVHSQSYQLNESSEQIKAQEEKFNAINEWKYFCYNQVVGKKLDILA